MQTAMCHILKVWRQHNPGAATYRALVDIVMDLESQILNIHSNCLTIMYLTGSNFTGTVLITGKVISSISITGVS